MYIPTYRLFSMQFAFFFRHSYLTFLCQNGEPDLSAFWARADGFFPESRPNEWVIEQIQPLHPSLEDSDPSYADVMFGELLEWRPGTVLMYTYRC
jgi:hypothetical protein